MPRKAGSRAKIAATVPVAPLPNDPTFERQQRDAFDLIPAPRMPGERLGRDRIVSTRRRVSALERMEMGTDPWLDRSSAAALERYALLIEQAGYDAGSQGCLNISYGGGSSGGRERIVDMKFAARQRLASAANAVADADPVALVFINAVLSPANELTMGELAKQLLRGKLVEARFRFVTAGQVLASYFAEL